MSPPPDDLVGRTLGHFRVVSLLGEGGMGVVYKAFDERLHRTIALKVLPEKAVREEAQRRAFLREARSAAAVSHPNVAAVYDVIEAEGRVFLAMEYIDGRTLRREIADRKLDLTECTRIARSIARALAKAHERGVVHRDLKPDNVMLNEDREVKVLDFGLAKVLEEAEKPPRESLERDETELVAGGEREIIGTPSYMSPEQAMGRDVDARADLFSFGILLYEMVTGVRPFRGGTSMDILTAIARDAPAPASSLNPRVPAALERIIDRCLLKRPEDRFSSARDLVMALEALEAGRPHLSLDAPLTPLTPGSSLLLTSHDANLTREPSVGSRRPRGGLLLPIALVVAGGAVVAAGVALRHPHEDVVAARDAGRRAPLPEAEKLVTDAEKLAREGRRDLACADYARASSVDPTYARAALDAMLCHLDAPNEGRPFFRTAWAARATLDDREAALLFALEPVFFREHEDDAEAAKRLDEAKKRFPDDARLHLAVAGSLRRVANGFHDVVEELERSLALDPQQPYALELEADSTAYEGDFDGALKVIDHCLTIAPAAEGCLLERAWIYGQQGECERVESDARRMLAIDPDDEDGAHVLANALYAEGRPLETAREVLRRNWERLPVDRRAATEREDQIHVAVLSGDLALAEQGARAVWSDAAGSALGADHGRAARRLLEIEREAGEPKDAADVARAYLDGRDAWEPSARLDDWALAAEPTPLMLAALRHAGRISGDAYAAELGRTFERWERTIEPPTRPFIWVEGYAIPATTPAEAQAAMAARARYLPVPPFAPLSLDEAAVGRVYLLAGRAAEALPLLDRATRSCFPLDHPIEHTQSEALLGRALEASGDAEGACKAYGVVLARWGNAKPRSLTASDALQRTRALRCAK